MVLFYEAGCPQCEVLTRIMALIAERMKDKTIIVSRINMSKNEIAELGGYTYPFIALLRSFNDQQSSIYEGDWVYSKVDAWIKDKV